MNKKTSLHFAGLALTAAIGILVDYLTKSHKVWAPIALALLVDLKPLAASLSGTAPAALVLLAALSLSGCSHVLGPVPPPGTPGFVNCSDTALHNAEVSILPNVETALASANWEQALLSIVAGIGGPLALGEVNCVVAWVESKAETSVGAATQANSEADPLEVTKGANAAAWLKAHPANITGTASVQ